MCYKAAIGIMAFVLYGSLSVSSNEECTSRNATIHIQTSCKQEDDHLSAAHVNNDVLEICRQMAVMFKCAVQNLPRCYDYFEAAIFNIYFHSPYSCELSQHQIMELQSIHNSGAENDDVILMPTSPVDLASTTLGWPESKLDEESTQAEIGQPDPTTHHDVRHRDDVTSGLHDGRKAGDSHCQDGCRRIGEQAESVANNGASREVFKKFPLLFLLYSLWRLVS